MTDNCRLFYFMCTNRKIFNPYYVHFKIAIAILNNGYYLFYNFNSLIWLTGIVEVVSTCSRQPKLITCSKNDNNNYNVPFLHVFNWKSNKHKQ